MANVIEFHKAGDNCSGSQAGNTLDGSLNYEIRCKDHDENFENDAARTLSLENFVVEGTIIEVFDHPDGSSTKDDWARITVNKSFSGMICVPTFEQDATYGANGEVTVNYTKVRGGNLNGKVSYIRVIAGS
jgi:hypothetical protein